MANVANDFSVFSNISPTNEDKQRELFENGEIENPDFEYPTLDFDPEDKAEAIEAIEVPEGEFEQQFLKRIENQEARNEVLMHRGETEKTIEASKKKYGEPSKEIVNYAEEILDTVEKKDRERPLKAEDVKKWVAAAIEEYQDEYNEEIFDEWSIEIDRDRDTGYASKKDKKFIIGDRDYLPEDPWRYVVHELGRHALQKVNRDYQKEDEERKKNLRHFAYDAMTEEGIAINLERYTGLETNEHLRKYALRTAAVDSVLERNSFRETYEKLSDWESDEDKLWTVTLRAHRGGGFIKDHIYLQGRENVKDYIESGSSLKPLYVGKVPLDSVDKAEELLENEKLEEPPYSPELTHHKISEIW